MLTVAKINDMLMQPINGLVTNLWFFLMFYDSKIICHLYRNCELGMSWELKEYRRRLSRHDEKNIFLLPWGGVVCRNSDDAGELVSYKSVTDYRSGDSPMWVVLVLVLFRENVGGNFSIRTIFLM